MGFIAQNLLNEKEANLSHLEKKWKAQSLKMRQFVTLVQKTVF